MLHNMDLEEAAEQLEALGNKTRLTIYRDLVQAGPQGITVGEIRENIEIPAYTFTPHQ